MALGGLFLPFFIAPSLFLFMIQRKSRGKRGWAISGRGVPPATLMENSHGGESRKLGAQKKCVYAVCSVLADGMGNGRIAWDPREKRSRDAQKQASVIWDEDLPELVQDLDISFGSMGSIMTKAIYFMSAPCKLANKCYWTK